MSQQKGRSCKPKEEIAKELGVHEADMQNSNLRRRISQEYGHVVRKTIQLAEKSDSKS